MRKLGTITRSYSFGQICAEKELSKANIEEAEKHLKESILLSPEGEYLPIWMSEPKDLGSAGIGVEMYFVYLKQMVFLFLIMSLFNIFALVNNITGDYLNQRQKNEGLQITTVANRNGLGRNVTTLQEAEDFISENSTIRNLYLIIDAVQSFTFLVITIIFILYNEYRAHHSQDKAIHTSHYSVEIQGLPERGVTEEELKAHLEETVGVVKECVFARNIGDTLSTYTTIAKLEQLLREEEIRCNLQEKQTSPLLEELKLKKSQAETLAIEQYPEVMSQSQLNVNRAYVIFNSLHDRELCLRRASACCGPPFPAVAFHGHYLTFSQANEPSDIIWENLEISLFGRIIRSALGIILTIFILIISFIAIYMASYYSSLLPSDSDCDEFETSTFEEIQTHLEDTMRVYCYCADLGVSTASEDTYESVCSDYIKQYYEGLVMEIACMIVVSVMNTVIKLTYIIIAKFERFFTITGEELSKFTKLFVSASINMILLIILINLNFTDSVDLSNYLPGGGYILAGSYKDFDRDWYVDIGKSMIILMLVQIVWPTFLDMIFWMPFCAVWRKCRQGANVIQHDLNLLYEGINFELWDRYAYSMASIFFVMAFSAGCPILVPCLLCYFFVRYWVDKYLILRFYKRPIAYGPEINERAFKILPFAIVLHLFFAIFTYSSGPIFGNKPILVSSKLKGETTSHYSTISSNFSGRFVEDNSLPFFILAIVFFVLIIAFLIFFPLIRLFLCCGKSSQISPEEDNNTFSEKQRELEINEIASYRLQRNPNYQFQIYQMKRLSQQAQKEQPEDSSSSEREIK